jgi:L-fuconolactonase
LNKREGVERIDSHQHFWNYDRSRHMWMSEEMEVLKKDFAPKDLGPLLKQCNLDGCVAIQASQSEAENDFLLKTAAASSIVRGIVGWVNLRSGNVIERLSFYKQFEKIKGFRHVIQDEPDLNFMLQPDFLNGVKALRNFGYTYDILIFNIHLPNTLELVKRFPDQPFVIDHLAKPEIRNHDYEDWRKQLTAIAAFSNVFCKISGMVTEAKWHRWKQGDFRIYLDTVVELFGTERIMYGSDWPVCTLSSSYEEMYKIVDDYFSEFSEDEQNNFFALNATRFYHL